MVPGRADILPPLVSAVRKPSPRRFAAVLATALGTAVLIGILGYSLRTLDRAPGLYGDEAWIGSIAWSFVNGHGFRPSLAVGAGVYEGTIDFWDPRLGTAPFILAELIAGTSYTAYRFASFLLGLVALGIFGWTLRRRFGWPMATWGVALLAASWGFYAASHYIRWDALAFVFVCTILALLLRGPVTASTALLVGFLTAVSADVEFSVMAITPGVVVLIVSAGARRLRRVGAFAAGLAAGGVAYVLAHGVPFGARAQEQFDAIYGNTYGVPMFESLKELSLDPLVREIDRYEFMTSAATNQASRLAAVTLLVGVLAAIVAIAYAIKDLRRPEPAYPLLAVPGVLLLSHVLGLALIQGNKTPMYVWYAFPYAIAAIIACGHILRRRLPGSAPRRIALPATVAVLALLTTVGATATVRDVRSIPKDPALDPAFASFASAVRPGETVMGEWLYWWAFRDEDFHYNSLVWLDRWLHDASLDQSFARLCPDVVLYDDVWDGRYDQTADFGRRFPSLAPTDPAEREQLRELLQRDYRVREQATIGGRNVELWERREAACDGSLTSLG